MDWDGGDFLTFLYTTDYLLCWE